MEFDGMVLIYELDNKKCIVHELEMCSPFSN